MHERKEEETEGENDSFPHLHCTISLWSKKPSSGMIKKRSWDHVSTLFAHDGPSALHNIWLLGSHWASTTKNKLHIKRKTDTVAPGRKGPTGVCVCVPCLFYRYRTHGWAVRACAGSSCMFLPPLTNSPWMHESVFKKARSPVGYQGLDDWESAQTYESTLVPTSWTHIHILYWRQAWLQF